MELTRKAGAVSAKFLGPQWKVACSSSWCVIRGHLIMKSEYAINDSFFNLPIIGWIIRHFENYRKLQPWPFLWRITLEGFLIVFPFAFIFTFLLDPTPRTDIEALYVRGVPYILLEIAIFAPLVETFILQTLPVALVRLFRASFTTQLIAAWIPFALLHFFLGPTIGVCAGLIRGFYFGFTYTHWCQRSKWTAIWTTSVSHMINNFILISIILMLNWITLR